MFVGRIILALSALLFGLVGLAFLVAPVRMAAYASIDVSKVVAKSDIRAVYGGLELGLAAFLAFCLVQSEWTKVGLLVQVLVLSGLILGRIVSLLADGFPEAPGVLYITIEVVWLLAGAVGLLLVHR